MRRAALTLGLFLAALTAAGSFVGFTYGAGAGDPPRVEKAKSLSGDVVLVDGVPIAHLRGTHYQIGYEQGVLFRDQIRFLKAHYYDAVAVPVIGRKNLAKWADAVEPFIPGKYKEELHGLADGCGLGYRDVLEVNAMLDRLQSLFCSTVAASGPATQGGVTYFGRNLDFPGRGILQRMTVVLVFEPDGETPIAAVTWPGLIGVLSGMSAKGVCGATMLIHRPADPTPGVPYPILYREALEQASSASDVYTFLRSAKRTCSNNFMVVDASGRAEVTEFTPDALARRVAQGGELCSTNFFVSDRMKGKESMAMGKDRFHQLQEFLHDDNGSIDLASVKKALREVARPWFMNVQSMIFLPSARRIDLAVSEKLPAADGHFVSLDSQVLFPPKAAKKEAH